MDVDSTTPEPEPATGWMAVLYGDLHRRAEVLVRREARTPTLSATVLLHDAWLRFREPTAIERSTRAYLFRAIVANMQRILIERGRRRARPQGGLEQDLVAEPLPADARTHAVREALTELERLDARKAQVSALRWIAGLELDDVARVLGISVRTVKRDWQVARAWLGRALHRDVEPGR